MSATLTLNQINRTIRSLPQERPTETSELESLKETVSNLLSEVKGHWHELPPERKQFFQNLAYALLDCEEKGPSISALFFGLRWKIFNLISSRYKRSSTATLQAAWQLRDEILSNIEKDQNDFTATISERFEKGVFGDSKNLRTEDLSAWAKSL